MRIVGRRAALHSLGPSLGKAGKHNLLAEGTRIRFRRDCDQAGELKRQSRSFPGGCRPRKRGFSFWNNKKKTWAVAAMRGIGPRHSPPPVLLRSRDRHGEEAERIVPGAGEPEAGAFEQAGEALGRKLVAVFGMDGLAHLKVQV